MIPPESRPKLNPKARLQTDRISGKPALLYPEGVLLLNPTGMAIVGLCDGTLTVDQMADSLSQRYAKPSESIRSDIVGYLERLRERGLIALHDAAELPMAQKSEHST